MNRGVRRLARRVALAAGALVGLVVLLVALYAGRVAWASRSGVAHADGTQTGVPVDGPVTVARDARGVPHIRAGSVHDLFVAEGYAMASDRLFQMDITRRYVDGRLAEVLGSNLVRVDRRMRRYGIRDLATSVFAHNFGSIVRPVYALWVALAFFAAVRTAGGGTIYTRRRR